MITVRLKAVVDVDYISDHPADNPTVEQIKAYAMEEAVKRISRNLNVIGSPVFVRISIRGEEDVAEEHT